MRVSKHKPSQNENRSLSVRFAGLYLLNTKVQFGLCAYCIITLRSHSLILLYLRKESYAEL